MTVLEVEQSSALPALMAGQQIVAALQLDDDTFVAVVFFHAVAALGANRGALVGSKLILRGKAKEEHAAAKAALARALACEEQSDFDVAAANAALSIDDGSRAGFGDDAGLGDAALSVDGAGFGVGAGLGAAALSVDDAGFGDAGLGDGAMLGEYDADLGAAALGEDDANLGAAALGEDDAAQLVTLLVRLDVAKRDDAGGLDDDAMARLVEVAAARRRRASSTPRSPGARSRTGARTRTSSRATGSRGCRPRPGGPTSTTRPSSRTSATGPGGPLSWEEMRAAREPQRVALAALRERLAAAAPDARRRLVLDHKTKVRRDRLARMPPAERRRWMDRQNEQEHDRLARQRASVPRGPRGPLGVLLEQRRSHAAAPSPAAPPAFAAAPALAARGPSPRQPGPLWAKLAVEFNETLAEKDRRSKAQIRTRWTEHLDPSVNRTDREIDIIRDAQRRMPNASELGGGDALDDACDVVASHALEGRFGANGLARVLAVAAPAAAPRRRCPSWRTRAEALASAPPTRATFLAAIAAGLAASRDDALLLPGADLLAPRAPAAGYDAPRRDRRRRRGRKGEALARDYGERPNLELLLAHGVCLADNAHDDRRLTAAGAEATLRRGGDIDADGAHFRAAAASDLAHLVALQEEGAAGDPPAAVAYRAGQILLLREFRGNTT
ncbi:RNA polymerase II transcription regulator recruiting protein [Aureococcus anophagefferens]|nr:RNA polymerase II transcription regulator recruiting protein [Aureococcus anophagefferens]